MTLLNRFSELEKRRVPSGLKNYLWKISGIVGNIFLNKKPPIKDANGKRYLNIGCGERKIKNWVNADYYRLHNLIYNRNMLPDWMLDLSKPLNCKSEYWDGVLLEHVNEHLPYTVNYQAFTEIYRILKKGAVCRIIVPDLDKYLQWENLKEKEPKMSRYGSLAEAVSNLTQNHAHIAVWNFDLLKEALYDVGFQEVNLSSHGISNNIDLAVGSLNHKWESLYVDAIK